MTRRAPQDEIVMSPARQLLMELVDIPEMVAAITADADLIDAGLNSGDLIRLALAIEERTQTPLRDEDQVALQTIDGIDRVLAKMSPSGTDTV